MKTSKDLRRDALTGIGTALRTSLVVPTDTMITDDIPLLLTKLSKMPYAPDGHAEENSGCMVGP